MPVGLRQAKLLLLSVSLRHAMLGVVGLRDAVLAGEEYHRGEEGVRGWESGGS